MTPGRTVEMSRECPGSTPKLPSVPGTTTMSTASDSSSLSGETSSNCTLSAIAVLPPFGSGRLSRHLARLGDRLVDGADHVESALRHVVVIAGDDAIEALDGVFEADQHAGRAGEHFGDMEGLR